MRSEADLAEVWRHLRQLMACFERTLCPLHVNLVCPPVGSLHDGPGMKVMGMPAQDDNGLQDMAYAYIYADKAR